MNNEDLERKVFNCDKCPNICSEFKMIGGYRLPEFGMKLRDHKDIMVIGQNPGFDQKLNSNLVNPNNFFDYYESRVQNYPVPSFIETLGIPLSSVYYTNLVKCPTCFNRPPTLEEAENCFEHLNQQINAISPKHLIVFGRIAREVLQKREDLYPFIENFYYLYHPSYIFRLKSVEQEDIISAYRVKLKNLIK